MTTGVECNGNVAIAPLDPAKICRATAAHGLQPSTGMALRVVLLTKPYPLATVLERRIASTGCLVGVMHEKSPSGWRGIKRETQRLVKRLGAARAADVVAY